jgi:hypothetical protein
MLWDSNVSHVKPNSVPPVPKPGQLFAQAVSKVQLSTDSTVYALAWQVSLKPMEHAESVQPNVPLAQFHHHVTLVLTSTETSTTTAHVS